MGVYVICSLFSYYLAILYLAKVFSPIYLILLPHICGFMVYIMGGFGQVYVSVLGRSTCALAYIYIV